MKLFLREHLSLLILQVIQLASIFGILWLDNFRNYSIIFYCLFLSFIFLAGFLAYKYVSKRELYQLLSNPSKKLDDSLQQLDHTPLSNAVSNLLRNQYNLYQEQIINLHNKQDEHLVFIDRWIHQMKTPISVLELIANELDEPESSNIREEVDRLKSGLATVMYMSRLRTIKEDFHIKKVRFKTLFKEIQRDNKRLYIRNKVYPKLAKNEDIIVKTDEKWLFFMINQLISNAVKYSANRSNEVIISIYERDQSGIFEIQDFGVGIPTSDIKRIFEPFYTGENGRKFRESTGVGLYIVQEIANYLGHQIEVESKVGQGSIFRIVFLN